GLTAVGVDPAAAILDRARTRPGGDTVTWLHGGPDLVPDQSADLAIMMGHVAQYFIADDAWVEVLAEAHRFLTDDGHLAFETRNPAIDWPARWNRDASETTYPHPAGGEFTSWNEVQSITGSPESYTIVHQGNTVLPDGQHLQVLESIRFRSPDEVRTSLAGAGFEIVHEFGDWDRAPFDPSKAEMIVVARRA
ncbi:MAG: methyltransferase domain-containing protein, partial [Actinomycetota bacterium]